MSRQIPSLELWVPDATHVAEGAVVYCDESGNSGPNYLDQAQPYYVLGSWVVPDAQVVEVAVAIEQFRSRYFSQRDEMKASAVLRNDRTKLHCVDLFRTLGRLQCVPLYLVAEKRYCVAGKIIETFIDPAYNDVVENPFAVDVATKQELANTLCDELPKGVIKQFAEAYRAPTVQGLGQALRGVARAVESSVSPELAELISGCKGHIDEIAAAEASSSPLGDVAGTLNMPCLVAFLMLVENIGRLGLARPIKIIHDQQHAYQLGYRRIFEMHRGLPTLFARLPNSEITYSRLEHVADFQTQDSRLSLAVQAADLLAGVIHHLFKLAANDQELGAGDKELAMATLPGLLVQDPRLTWLLCSEACIQRLGSNVLKPSIACTDTQLPEPDLDERIESALAPMAPMFPRNQGAAATKSLKLKADLPLYGLLGRETNSLMFVENADAEDEALRRVLYLFSTEKRAIEFIELWDENELSQPQYVAEFGPSQLEYLADLLEAGAEHCEALTIDPEEGPLRLTRTGDFAQNIRRIIDRTRRVFTSGADSVIVKKHAEGSREIMSLYCHDGKYAAMFPPGGQVYFGKTREEALDALRRGERE